jgi:D-serine deaminase-like pyridoxal phosphate-dependent protein
MPPADPRPAAPGTLEELETPALVVDLDRMDRNLDRAAAYARQHRLRLRPHTKTHKSPVLGRAQIDRGAAGLTCATVQEAEVMSAVCDDILIMYPPVGAPRANRVAALAQRARVTVALDSEQAAQHLSLACAKAGTRVGVLVELDAGMHRVGVASIEAGVGLARSIAELPGIELAGIAFYPGHVRAHVAEHAPQLVALTTFATDARDSFERAGFPATIVSAGSTPTIWETHLIGGVTEMRPGTYVFNDRTTSEIGACAPDDCALTVLATVVSTAVPGQAVIDAGTKALGREPIRGVAGEGFGALLDRPRVVVKGMSEEHGLLDLSATDWRPRVGDRVRVVPNHVCIVVHLADLVYGVRGGVLENSWPVAARGRGHRAVS